MVELLMFVGAFVCFCALYKDGGKAGQGHFKEWEKWHRYMKRVYLKDRIEAATRDESKWRKM